MIPSPIRTIVGIDAAAQPERTGVAVGRRIPSTNQWRVTPVPRTRDRDSLVSHLAGAVNDADGPVLLAVDAPLGWPAPMGEQLSAHNAGEPLSGDANAFFRRETDRFVAAHLQKHPLDVGSNLIARAAFAALQLVASLNRETGRRFPLAWEPTVESSAMIEVYPAAWLLVNDAPSKGYKKAPERPIRELILQKLVDTGMRIESTEVLLDNADALDAVVTVQLGVEFLQGGCRPPSDREAAQREGWIWIPERPYKSEV